MDDDLSIEDSSRSNDNLLGLSLPSPNPSKFPQQQRDNSLETLLSSKNKRISEELAKLRVRKSKYSFTRILSNELKGFAC